MGIQSVIFKTGLLVGLLFVGLVEKDAQADMLAKAHFSPTENSARYSTAEISSQMALPSLPRQQAGPDGEAVDETDILPMGTNGPALVRLSAETLHGLHAWDIYFPRHQITLTDEASLFVAEIMSELDGLGAYRLILEFDDADPFLGWERVQTIAARLEATGFAPGNIQTASDLELATLSGL